ncbi:dUTP diphosphatase [Rickettsiales bacterium LUAb2]
MGNIRVNIVLMPHYSSEELPSYASLGSSGLDLRAAIEDNITLAPLQRVLVPTGIQMEIPEMYEGLVRPRSGLAINHGISVLNTPGTIDSDYRGEIKIILINLSDKEFIITKNMKIAQIVIAPIAKADLKVVEILNNTVRAEKGFGSSGL